MWARAFASLVALAIGLLLQLPYVDSNNSAFLISVYKVVPVAALVMISLLLFPTRGLVLRLLTAAGAFLIVAIWMLVWTQFAVTFR